MLILLVPWLFAITSFAVSSHRPRVLGSRVITFHVPAHFQTPERRWIPPEARGKLLEFPAPGVRKSA